MYLFAGGGDRGGGCSAGSTSPTAEKSGLGFS